MLDHHHGGVGYVDSDLDYSRGNENVDLAFLEAAHDVFFLISAQSAVQEFHSPVGKDLLAEFFVHFESGFELGFFVLLDHGIHHVGLVAGGDLLATNCQTSSARSSEMRRVTMGVRPGGISSRMLMSRSP